MTLFCIRKLLKHKKVNQLSNEIQNPSFCFVEIKMLFEKKNIIKSISQDFV